MVKPGRIAITGSHQVGKTTLAELLHEELPGHTLHIEPYLYLEQSGHVFDQTPRTEDFLFQLDYALKLFSQADDPCIFDRSPLDLLAYVYALEPNMDMQQRYQEVKNAMTDLSLLVYVPIESPDMVTAEAVDYPRLRTRVDSLLSEWISDMIPQTVRVSGSVHHRIGQVLRACGV